MLVGKGLGTPCVHFQMCPHFEERTKAKQDGERQGKVSV